MQFENQPERSAVEEAAARIFGSADSPAYRRWVEYWKSTRERTRALMEAFEAVVLFETDRRRILDIGCGTGALADVMAPRGCRYFGVDYHRHMLRLAPGSEGRALSQGNAMALPFPDGCFNLVVAFDVIEHLTGGKAWQSQFLREVSRVMAPQGLAFLTTPNFWCPYDAHTGLNGPQFMPRLLREPYLRWRNPGFIKEHGSFDSIQLMRPGFLRKALRNAGLAPLHDLPCCLDREDYRSIHPFVGRLIPFGLGWLPHAEFWTILVRREARRLVRRRLRKNWPLEHAQPESRPITGFQPVIDFSRGFFGHQLGSGWHWHEQGEPPFRWMGRQAIGYLLAEPGGRSITLKGFAPWDNRLQVRVDGSWVGDARLPGRKVFERRYLIPARDSFHGLVEVRLEAEEVRRSEGSDIRDLGVMIFRMGLEA